MLNKIFRIGDNDPLLWQISYNDSEVDKIIASRFRRSPAKTTKKTKKQAKSLLLGNIVERLPLNEDSIW
jgi:hypothetical protein